VALPDNNKRQQIVSYRFLVVNALELCFGVVPLLIESN